VVLDARDSGLNKRDDGATVGLAALQHTVDRVVVSDANYRGIGCIMPWFQMQDHIVVSDANYRGFRCINQEKQQSFQAFFKSLTV
jgi:hypothetical protein